jgi:hypothetical protein
MGTGPVPALVTLLLGGVFGLFGLYALSGARRVGRLPLRERQAVRPLSRILRLTNCVRMSGSVACGACVAIAETCPRSAAQFDQANPNAATEQPSPPKGRPDLALAFTA